MTESAFTFDIKGDQVVAILHEPEENPGPTGLLIVVGGPQYRIGAHRQYVHLARYCAEKGITVMRFDYRGIGDSEGTYPGFENVTPDIMAALDIFRERCPSLQTIVPWGLCEGASALLTGALNHEAVRGAIITNPWVRSKSSLAKTMVKHYYGAKFRDPAFWKSLFTGKINLMSSLSGFFSNLKKSSDGAEKSSDFRDVMCEGLHKFQGKTLLIQSGNDLVAREFDELVATSDAWQAALKDTKRVDIPGTDHTFSSEKWRGDVAKVTSDWVLSL